MTFKRILLAAACAATLSYASPLAAATLLLPGTGSPDGVATEGPGWAVRETKGEGEVFEFKVELEAGKAYFFGGVSDELAHVAEVVDPAGTIIKVFQPIDSDISGVEVRAATTATYLFRFRQTDGDLSGIFAAFFGPDCAAGIRTLCTLRPGVTKEGRWDVLTENPGDGQPGRSEQDAYRVRLVAGRSYVATISLPEGDRETPMRVAFLDAERRVIVERGEVGTEDPPRVAEVSVRFRPRRTGDYFVQTGGAVSRKRHLVSLH